MLKKILCALSALACVLWTVFIFSNSMDTAAESTEKSDVVYEVVNDIAENIGVEKEISKNFIRQSGHFFEFAALGALAALSLSFLLAPPFDSPLSPRLALCALSLPYAVIIAFIDEYIQTFSDGRVCDMIDVLTDSLGALFGIALFTAVFFICRATVRLIKKKRSVPN